MKYTIFVSYSWKNVLHRSALITCLSAIQNVDVKLDKVNVELGTDIWNTISSMLDESDCMVTILTDASINSLGVYQELVIAHERGIEIIPICHESISPKSLPPFLAPLLQLRYRDDEGFEEALGKLRVEIERRRDRRKNRPSPRRRLQNLLREMNAVELKNQEFRLRVLDKILESVTKEVRKLSDSYTLDIGVEANFLLRARPMFSSADMVYAVSADHISTFWLKPDLVEASAQYIGDQRSNTVRLFVFDTPASAHQYSEILEAHSRRYGAEGAVLLCSSHSYQGLLKRISGKPETLNGIDFAVLMFDGYQLAATLDHSRLHFHQINIDRDQVDSDVRINYETYIGIMSELAKTEVGEFNEKYTVLRWSDAFMDNRALWAEKLNGMFGSALGVHSGDLYHIVILSKTVPADAIVQVRNSLRNAKINAELQFDSLWSGKRVHPKVADGIYHGTIDTGSSDESGTVLMFHFDCAEDLRRYYSGPAHAIIRRQVFEAISSEIRDEYALMDRMMQERKDVSKNYERIEALAAPFIQRWDFLYDEKINDLVKGPPHPFPHGPMDRLDARR